MKFMSSYVFKGADGAISQKIVRQTIIDFSIMQPKSVTFCEAIIQIVQLRNFALRVQLIPFDPIDLL